MNANRRRSPTDTRLIEWADRGDFSRARAEWAELVRRDVALEPVWRLVLLEIASRFGHDRGSAWPSIPRVAADVGVSESTVRRAIACAVDRGLLIIEKRGFAGSNHYSMAISHRIASAIAAKHEDRVAQFEHARRPSLSSPKSAMDIDAIPLTRELSLSSPKSAHSAPPRALMELTQERVTLPSIPTSEAAPTIPTRGLNGAAAKASLLEILGNGDPGLGEKLAEILGRGRVGFLLNRISEAGIAGAADEIRLAAETAARLSQSDKQEAEL